VVIGVVGVQMTALEPWMPLWGSGELIVRAGGVGGTASVTEAVTHAVVATIVLMVVGAALWVRHTRLRPATRVLPSLDAVRAGRAPARRPLDTADPPVVDAGLADRRPA
jgi:hypothetical protein